MAVLTGEAKELIANIHPSLIATANRAGVPNVSAKGSLRVLDDEHVMFADVNSPRTIANLQENPIASIIVLDAATRRGVRVWGKATVHESGPLLDEMNSALAARNLTAKHVVVVDVDDFSVF